MQKTAIRLSLRQRTLLDPLYCEKNQPGGLELSSAAQKVQTPVACRKHKPLWGWGNLTFDKLRQLKRYGFV
jgi:hypothetical protein